MNYKTIIKSRETRIKILKLLRFIPDKPMVMLQYKIKLGRFLNLKNPKRFTEKLQWLKLYYRNDLMIKCVDKYDVRDYVINKGLAEILIPCYGVFDCVEEIDFAKLPKEFVAKDTLGGGGNSVIIVKDSSKVNVSSLKKRFIKWTNISANSIDDGREWPYSEGKRRHRIIIEQYISTGYTDLVDYKFFCFNGKVEYLYVLTDRIMGKDVALGVFNRDFKQLNVYRADERHLEIEISAPDNFDEMIHIAEKLSSEFPHARIDLYNNNGQILFGEITFFDGSGYMRFEPDEFDYTAGEFLKLPKKNN